MALANFHKQGGRISTVLPIVIIWCRINSKLSILTISTLGGSDDQCGCNNNLYKWCLTHWPKKIVSNISNKTSLQRPSENYCTSLTTNLVPKASSPIRVKPKNKSSWDKIVWKSEKRFYCFWYKKLRSKISKWQLFLSTHCSPLFYWIWMQLIWTNQFC